MGYSNIDFPSRESLIPAVARSLSAIERESTFPSERVRRWSQSMFANDRKLECVNPRCQPVNAIVLTLPR